MADPNARVTKVDEEVGYTGDSFPVANARVTKVDEEVGYVGDSFGLASARVTKIDEEVGYDVGFFGTRRAQATKVDFEVGYTEWLEPMQIEFRMALDGGLVDIIDILSGELECRTVDILVLLDHSLSTAAEYGGGPGTRFEAAQQALIALVGAVEDASNDSRFGLVTYSLYFRDDITGMLEGEAAALVNPPGLTDDWAALITAIGSESPGGYGTPTGDALAQTRTIMESVLSPDAQAIILLISDGEWNFGIDPIPVAESLVADHPDWLLFAVDINDGSPNPSNVNIGNIGNGFTGAANADELSEAVTLLADPCLFARPLTFEIEFGMTILSLIPHISVTGIFDDCGVYHGLREWEARLYDHQDPDTGKRRAYGPDGYDLDGVIQTLKFEIQERGGYGGGSFEFLADWEETDLAGTERVDVWLWDEPAYRAYLRIAQRELNAIQSASPQLYGMVALLDQWKVKRKYAYGCPTDVATIARDIALDYVAVTGRFPNISLEMSTAVGVTLKEYDGRGKSVAQSFNELADMAPNQAIWGHIMDDARPVPGDTLYFSPKPTTTVYVIPVGDNIQAFTYPSDTHDIVNSLTPLKGGAVKQPNIAINGGFEEVKPASEENGNLLLNPGFEDDSTHWTAAGGTGSTASTKEAGGVDAFGAARTGNHWAELDTAGESFYQDVAIIPLGHYEVSCWSRLEDSTQPQTGLLTITALDAANIALTSDNVALAPLTGVYARFAIDLDLASWPTATKIRITIESDGGTESNDGIIVDDCGVYEYCAVAQETWRVTPTGACVIEEMDWAFEDVVTPIPPRSGEYLVHIKASSIAITADTAELYYLPSESPSVLPNERYTLVVWWHTNGGGTPGDNALTIGAVSIKSDESAGATYESDTVILPAGPPTTYQMAKFDIMTASDTAKLQLFIRVRTNEHIYLDDVMLVAGEVPSEVESFGGYWTGDSYERYIDVTETVQNTNGDAFDTMLDVDVADSIDTYGEHEDDPSNDLVTDLDTALAFASGQFNAKALPKIEARLEIFAARQLIAQEGKLRIVNLPDPPPALWPSRSSYTISPEAILCSVELGNQRPDLASLLLLTGERARKGLT